MVSSDFFPTLEVQPRLGRFFIPTDRVDEEAAAPVAVISESLWRRRFAADPAVPGRTIKLNQHDFTVAGVAPASFLGSLNGLDFDVWVPICAHSALTGPSRWLETRSWRSLHTLARLAPGTTVDAARAELAGLARQLAAAHPQTNQGIGLAVSRLADAKDGAHSDLAKPLLLLLASGLLLLVVCANLANLLLFFVRASTRQRETCIRQALGAGSWRLVRQLLAESLVLSAAGALLGLLFTLWMADLLRTFIPDATLPIALAAGLSGRVLFVAIALSTATTLLAGLAPALWAARPNLVDALRSSSRAAALTPRVDFFRRSLVVAQVAVSLITSLAPRSHGRVSTPPGGRSGLDSTGVLLAALKLDTSGYSRADAVGFLDRLQPRLAALPGVESAALAEDVPLGLSRGSWEEVALLVIPAPQEDMRFYRNLVSPGYFALMRIPLLAGRDFTAADREGAPFVAIVNETFARRYLGGVNATGRTFAVWGGNWVLTVVGVARDIKVHRLDEAAQPYYYVPLQQFFFTDTGLAIQLRTRSPNPMALLPAMRTAVGELDPNISLFEALTLEDFVSGCALRAENRRDVPWRPPPSHSRLTLAGSLRRASPRLRRGPAHSRDRRAARARRPSPGHLPALSRPRRASAGDGPWPGAGHRRRRYARLGGLSLRGRAVRAGIVGLGCHARGPLCARRLLAARAPGHGSTSRIDERAER